MQNKKIWDYTLLRLLGKGGMAEVWYAENDIEKPAAVKILNPDFSLNTQIVERFRNEARVMVKLNHPNIRQVYSYTAIDGRPCIVMEYLEGDDLSSRLKRRERFNDEQLKKWWNQLVSALNYTHAQGVVHRDIKPSNIFIDREGNVKLLDFGIAKVRDSITSTATGAMMGTLMYMSPEQVRDSKHIDHKTDLYSLAVTFVHLLTGQAPYDRDTTDDFEIRNNIVNIPMDLAGMPAKWQSFLQPYLAKNPADRPALTEFGVEASPVDFVPPVTPLVAPSVPASEETFVGGASVVATSATDEGTVVETPSAQPQSQPQTQPRKAWPWILAACAVVIAVVVVIVMLGGEKGSKVINEEQGGGKLSNVEFLNQDRSFIVGNVSFTMKPVEGGTFQMGGNDSEAEADEKPVHDVTLSSFYMGETEVTQALWQAVMGNNPCYFKGDNLPVEQVSWNDCQDFIQKLNELVSEQLPAGWHFALPTEAQWEYAARGGNRKEGCKYSGSNTIGNVAWCWDNSNGRTHPVKGKNANGLGLYDMSGNVWEWCADWYGDYSSLAQAGPQGPSEGSIRVLRGGSWDGNAGGCRVSNRYIIYYPDNCRDDYGFRLALVQQ